MLFSFLFLVMCASDNSNPLLLQVFGSFGDHRAFMFFSLCVLLFGTAAQMHGFNADSNKAVQLFAQTFLVIGHLYITAAAAVQKSGQFCFLCLINGKSVGFIIESFKTAAAGTVITGTQSS